MYIFVGLHPSCSVSKLVGLLKCNSAGQLFSEFPELKGKLWKAFVVRVSSIVQLVKLMVKQSNATLSSSNTNIRNLEIPQP